MITVHPGLHPADKIAYEMAASGRQVTYAELNATSNQGARLLRSLGLVPGDGIALLLDNDVRYLQICWAAQRSGLYYTPISCLFQAAEINYILDNSDARVLVTSQRQLAQLPGLLLPPGLQVYLTDADTPWPSWDSAVAAQSKQAVSDECEGAEMIYSSGTTGQPKGVRFALQQAPLGSVSSLFKTRVKLHQVSPQTRYLSTAPLYHSAPLRYSMMVTRLGGTVVIMEKFDPEQALALIQAHQISHSQWVPTMFVRLLKLSPAIRARYRLPSLRYAIHAAAPCPVAIKQQMIDWWGPILYEYYSGTEANGSTAITSAEWLTHKGSVGRAIHGTLHILDDAGNELPTGEVGNVYFADGSDFSYYKDPIKTAAAKTADGWSTLGDVGVLDEEGYLYLRDRKSFMIISGGVNIYPQEIESLLVNHPLVADAAVFGIPNDEFGEEVKAVVELLAPDTADPALAATLMDYCRANLSHVKCPRSLDFTPALPRHPTGKLYKQLLRAPYWVGHASAII